MGAGLLANALMIAVNSGMPRVRDRSGAGGVDLPAALADPA